MAELAPLLAGRTLHHQIGAMGTTLEESLGSILRLVEEAQQTLRKRSSRILIELVIDDRDTTEGELVRSIQHVRVLSLGAPLERFVSSGGRE